MDAVLYFLGEICSSGAYAKCSKSSKSCRLMYFSSVTGVGTYLSPLERTLTWLSLSCWFEKFFVNFSLFFFCLNPLFSYFFPALFAVVICFVPFFILNPCRGG